MSSNISQDERLVQKELRKALLKYKLHTDQELLDKAYGYIRQYYLSSGNYTRLPATDRILSFEAALGE